MNIKVIIENGEDGYFVARVQALKGCWSHGKTKKEASQDAARNAMSSLKNNQKEIANVKV